MRKRIKAAVKFYKSLLNSNNDENMSIPIFAPFSILISERMEIEFNITEATYVRKKFAEGIIYIIPELRESDTVNRFIEMERKRAENLPLASPILQYTLNMDPPKPIPLYPFRKVVTPSEMGLNLGYLLLRGIESIDLTRKEVPVSKGAIAVQPQVSRGLMMELSKEARKKLEIELPYQIDFTKIKELVEGSPDIRRELYKLKKTFEIPIPIMIHPHLRDATEILDEEVKLDRSEMFSKLGELERKLRGEGKSEPEISDRLAVARREEEGKIDRKRREYEKYRGYAALHTSIENTTDFTLEGNILISEFAINFPTALSRSPIGLPREVEFTYDPAKMQAIWKNFGVNVGRSKDLMLLAPYEELRKIERVTGEIRLTIRAIDDILPSISLLKVQEICNARGIPILEDLKKLKMIEHSTSTIGSLQISPQAIYIKPLSRVERMLEFEGVHPRGAYETLRKVYIGMAIELIREEEPKILTRFDQEDIKDFSVWLEGRAFTEEIPVYLTTSIEGPIFYIREEKIAPSERFRRILREYGNTRITTLGTCSNLELLTRFIDQLQDIIRDQISRLRKAGAE